METGIQKYLDSAVEVLDKFGILQKKTEGSELANVLEQLVSVDQSRVTAIARVVQYESSFNELARDKIKEMKVSNGYQTVTDDFTSIKVDYEALEKQREDNKLDWAEKAANIWMNVTRGTIPARFTNIRDIYLDVSRRTKEQLDSEKEIMKAYTHFRLAMKGAEVMAYEVLEIQEANLTTAKDLFIGAASKVTDYKGTKESEKSTLQLQRDQLEIKLNEEDRRYQLIKNVAENLKIGYNVGEGLMANLRQTHNSKEAVYLLGITFFGTNEHLLTALAVNYVSQAGLHEQTQVVESMKKGINEGIEQFARTGTKLKEAAIDTAYGATISADSHKKLVDAIATFQEQSYQRIRENREKATNNAKEIERITDEGKERTSKALENYLTKKK